MEKFKDFLINLRGLVYQYCKKQVGIRFGIPFLIAIFLIAILIVLIFSLITHTPGVIFVIYLIVLLVALLILILFDVLVRKWPVTYLIYPCFLLVIGVSIIFASFNGMEIYANFLKKFIAEPGLCSIGVALFVFGFWFWLDVVRRNKSVNCGNIEKTIKEKEDKLSDLEKRVKDIKIRKEKLQDELNKV